MTTVAALRLSIVKQIQDRLIEVMGDPTKISIADNGNIVLSDGVFFDLGSSDLKPESYTVLNELIDAFAVFLNDTNTTQYVDSIVISGHTDSFGTEAENRILSTDRANSVLNYLLFGKGEKLAPYAPFFCAADAVHAKTRIPAAIIMPVFIPFVSFSLIKPYCVRLAGRSRHAY